MGIVLGPRVNDELSAVELDVNIRVLDGDDEGVFAIDALYTYDDLGIEDYMQFIYPEVIGRFEEAFADSQLQYFEP